MTVWQRWCSVLIVGGTFAAEYVFWQCLVHRTQTGSIWSSNKVNGEKPVVYLVLALYHAIFLLVPDHSGIANAATYPYFFSKNNQLASQLWLGNNTKHHVASSTVDLLLIFGLNLCPDSPISTPAPFAVKASQDRKNFSQLCLWPADKQYFALTRYEDYYPTLEMSSLCASS